jgi:hypothetical protein
LQTPLHQNYICINGQLKEIMHQSKNYKSTKFNEAANKMFSDSACPKSLTATSGDNEGEIDLVWEPVKKAHTYVVQKCRSSKSHNRWENEDIVAKSSYTVTNLKRGQKYLFRVAAIGQKGQGAWSEPVQKKAPK